MRTILIGTLTLLWTAFPFAGRGPAEGPLQIVEIQSGPPRDRAPVRRSGTATVRGRVIDGASGAAIPRARVRVQIGGVGPSASLTGGDGEFAFTNLPGGPMMLSVEKATYLPARSPERGRTFRSMNRPVNLEEGQTIDGLVIRMYHGSAISGRILDAHGDPVEFASVSAMRLLPGGRPEVRGGVQTNDLGEYRVPKLQPGRYLLMVVPRPLNPDESLPHAEQPPQPVATYYPSASSPEFAQPLVLERGRSSTGIDVVLGEGMPVLVTGVVVRRDGEPVTGGYVQARMASRGMHGGMGGGTGLRPDGTFRLVMHPGDYIVQAIVAPRPTSAASPAPGSEQTGMIRLAVGGSPGEAVTIVVGAAASASGRVFFEGATPTPPAPTGPLHLPLFSPDGACRTGEARVSPDWTFRVEGLLGMCLPPAQLMFGRWTLKAATRAGDNLLEGPTTFEPGQHMDGVQLVFTDRRSELIFRVTDDRAQPTRDYLVLVFPTDRGRWADNPMLVRPFFVPPADMLQQAARPMPHRPNTEVSPRREAMSIAPGDYYAIAIDDVSHEDARSPEVLERLAASATRVVVGEGANVEVALRRIPAAQLLR